MDTPNVIDIPLETSKVVNVPIVNLIPVNENSNRINVESKKYTEIPTKDIQSDGKKNFIDSTSTSFPYKFLQDVSSFVDRTDYKEYQLQAHVDEAYLALTSRFTHLKNAPLEYFLNEKFVKTAFAKLVALCIRTSNSISGSVAQLDKMYLRINLEKKKIMHWFAKHKYKGEDEADESVINKLIHSTNEMENFYKQQNLFRFKNPNLF